MTPPGQRTYLALMPPMARLVYTATYVNDIGTSRAFTSCLASASLRAGAGRDVRVVGPSAQHAVRPADLDPAAAADPAAAICRAMREVEPAQPTAAHRTASYALASGLHQPKGKQKIIDRETVDSASGPACAVLRWCGILVVNSSQIGELARLGL
jgi:hypothetical protein